MKKATTKQIAFIKKICDVLDGEVNFKKPDNIEELTIQEASEFISCYIQDYNEIKRNGRDFDMENDYDFGY